MTAVLGAILFLLKFLGILLLALLGLLLLILLLVLLAPVRYRGRIKKSEEPDEVFFADGLVSWLNPFLRVRVQYTEKKLRYTVRIFGISLMNSERAKRKKHRRGKRSKRKEADKRKEEEKNTAENLSGGREEETIRASEPAEQLPLRPEGQHDSLQEPEKARVSGEKDNKKKTAFTKRRSPFQRGREILEGIKQKAVHLGNSLKLLWYKKEKATAFFEDELHRLALGKVWKTIKELLRHVLPGRVRGHVEFGTGDPESTGKALGALGIMYAAYGKGVTIVPDFYEKRLLAELTFRGRIRFGTLLLKGLRLICDKQVKQFYKNMKKLFKVLKQQAE